MQPDAASFRDPSGFIFTHEGEIYRNVNTGYSSHYEFLLTSGLCNTLVENGWLIRHQVVSDIPLPHPSSYIVIKPDRIPVITYPHEWCFSQLKAGALLTLEILRLALQHGMILKDASGFNIQFRGYEPVFIDTLSFEIYQDGQSWKGYRQFCEHFLAPLSLLSHFGANFQSLFTSGVDGIPLEMASRLLPKASWLKPSTLFHIHLHSRSVSKHARKKSLGVREKPIPKTNLMAMVEHLISTVKGIQLKESDQTQWKDYHKETHYSDEGRKSKAAIITQYVQRINPHTVWDIGSNDGFFSRQVSSIAKIVLSMDADQLAVERNYLKSCAEKEKTLYPLIFDITNPLPDFGWANRERVRLSSRSSPDAILALALIHHLVVTHNIPFDKVAGYLASLSFWVIIEFVPAEDEKIRALPDTAGKKEYTRQNFEEGFLKFFEIVKEERIKESDRSIMLLKRK